MTKKKGKRMKVSVVVANNDRDINTLKYSLYKTVEFIEVNLGFERSKQRNIGIKKATGDIVLWLDSDQTVQRGLIEEIQNLISKGYTSLYIPEVLVVKSFFGKIRKFEREFYTATAVDVPRAVRRIKCPLFNEELHGPEDADWGRRVIGMRGTTKKVIYHHDDIGILEYFRKKNLLRKEYAEVQGIKSL